MGDKLVLRGMLFHGYHGVQPEQKKLGQKFLVDIDAWIDLQPAGVSDDLSDSVNYADMYGMVKEIVEGPSHDVLESLAQEIATTVLNKFTRISSIRILLGKPHAAVQGPIDYMGIEITKHRSDTK